MTPTELKPEQFNDYPPLARQMAIDHIAVLRELPLAFLPLLLREVIVYDWKFPAERAELDHQLAYLTRMRPEQMAQEMAGFQRLRLSADLEAVNWVNAPGLFSEQMSAHLWATHQLELFRTASIEYVRKMNAAAPQEALPMTRLGVVIIGQGVTENQYRLFRKLRPHGVCFNRVQPENGMRMILGAVEGRAKAQPIPFAHWYIEGGETEPHFEGLTSISYKALEPVRSAILGTMRHDMTQASTGPEALRTKLAKLVPGDVGLNGTGDEVVLNRFQVSVLAEGSGTQIFSTTFVQWSAREALRRAQPLTLVARYAPRQQEHSMEQLLAGAVYQPVPDPKGSLVDADMGAYYTWINQQRLRGAEAASFLVWFEGHGEAIAIAPSLKAGTEEGESVSLSGLLNRLV
jgi:hypothetical protein